MSARRRQVQFTGKPSSEETKVFVIKLLKLWCLVDTMQKGQIRLCKKDKEAKQNKRVWWLKSKPKMLRTNLFTCSTFMTTLTTRVGVLASVFCWPGLLLLLYSALPFSGMIIISMMCGKSSWLQTELCYWCGENAVRWASPCNGATLVPLTVGIKAWTNCCVTWNANMWSVVSMRGHVGLGLDAGISLFSMFVYLYNPILILRNENKTWRLFFLSFKHFSLFSLDYISPYDNRFKT